MKPFKHIKQDAEPVYGAAAMKPKLDKCEGSLQRRIEVLEYQMKQLLTILSNERKGI
jgi:hypothetical protein